MKIIRMKDFGSFLLTMFLMVNAARQRCLDAVLEKGLDGTPPSSYVSPLGEKIEFIADAFLIGIKGR